MVSRESFSKEVSLDLGPEGKISGIWIEKEETKVCRLPRKQHDSNPGGRSKSVWKTDKYGLFHQLMFIGCMPHAWHCSRLCMYSDEVWTR